MKLNSYTYKIKCRYCDKVTKLQVGFVDRKSFEQFIEDKTYKPQHCRCLCDETSMILHDLVSYCL